MSRQEIKFEQIEKYLSGKMSTEEVQAYETELLENKALRDEVALHRHLAKASAEHDVIDFRASVKSIIKNETEQKTRKQPSQWNFIRIAASISIILLTGIVVNHFFLDKASSQQLFASYYEPYKDLVSGRSNENKEDAISKAMMFYNQADYAQAETYFKQIDISNKPLLSLYQGICYLNLNDFKNAHDTFSDASEKDNLFSSELKWYNALTYLKEENKSQAKVILEEIINAPSNSGYKQKAQTLLNKF